MKTRITEDLQKARDEGGLRTERIRAIVKEAIAQTLTELKGGSGELGGIARDAVATVITDLRSKGQETSHDIQASVEGAIEGISTQRRTAIAQTQSQVEQLQSQIIKEEAQLKADVDGALVTIETAATDSSAEANSLLEQAIAAAKDSEAFEQMQQQYARLKAKLAVLDANLAARYGDRYDDVKTHLENAKSWYERTKAEQKAGEPTLIEQKQTELEAKFSELGTAISHREKRVKELLSELWTTVTKL
jgi:hypothetical protein